MIKGTLLIVDENKDILKALEQIMKNEFENVITLTDPNRINEILRKHDVDIVMLDMNFKAGVHNGNEGLFWMREIFNHDNNISVIIVTASGDIELAVKAIKEGAVDFILKPWEDAKLLATINVHGNSDSQELKHLP
jgi:DNA-binding NtrC family response regulator